MAEPTLKNSVAVGEGRLIEQFEDKPNILGVLDAFLEETQAVEDLAFEVNTAFDKDTAIGVQLDVIGKLVGESREGRSDEPYRDAINGQIDANTADGTLDNVTDIITRSLPDSVDYFSAVNQLTDPYNPAGWYGETTDPDGTITNEDLLNPSGQSLIGLVEQTGTGSLLLARTIGNPISVVAGDKVYLSCIAKDINIDAVLEFFFDFTISANDRARVNVKTGENEVTTGSVEVSFTPLSDGFSLIQCEKTVEVDDIINDSRIVFFETDRVVPPIGSQLHVQAAFSGRTGKSLGAITYEEENQMTAPFYPENWDFDNVNLSITKTIMDNPSGESFTGLVEQIAGTNGNVITGSTFQVLNGQTVYISILVKSVTNDNYLRFRFGDSGGQLGSIVFNASDGVIQIDDVGLTAVVDTLANGFFLYQVSFPVVLGDLAFETQVELTDSGGAAAPPVGSKVYAQAAFSGVSTNLPAILSEPDSDLFPATVTLGEDKSVIVFEHFPADIHVLVNSPESQAISDSLDDITSVGVRRTMAFQPESSTALIPQELDIIRSFLITDNGDQIVVEDGGLKDLVVSKVGGMTEETTRGYLAELVPEDGARINTAFETLRTS